MNTKERPRSRKLMTQNVQYGVKLNYVLFPMDFIKLRDVLAKNAYELAEIREPLPPPPTRISFAGEIARKGETSLRIDSTAGDIILVGKSLEEVKVAFDQLFEVLEDSFGIDLRGNIQYYLAIAHYELDTGRKPSREIAKVVMDNPYFSRFKEILNEPVSLFSVRLFPKDKIPNQDDWFDVSIEPNVLNANLYHIGVVFRNPDRKISERFVKNLEKNLLSLVEIIEE